MATAGPHSHGKTTILSSTREYDVDKIIKKYYAKGDTNTYDAYQKDVALVNIFFETPTIVSYEKAATMTE
jgi:hypothetical protein